MKITLFKKNGRKSKESSGLADRIRISKAQQQTLGIVSVASILIGGGMILIIWFFKYIMFNSYIIDELDKSISQYSSSIENSGACQSPRSGKIYTVSELNNCIPDEISSESVPGSLKYNILNKMSANKNLQSVARESSSVCKNVSTGKDYTQEELLKQYQATNDPAKQAEWFEMILLCSSLRTVTDALPARFNENSLLISMDELYRLSGYSANSVPSSGSSESNIGSLEAVPVRISVDDEEEMGLAMRVLKNFENSIRTFNVSSASIEWSEDKNKINLNANANAYYGEPIEFLESQVTLRANNKKKGK